MKERPIRKGKTIHVCFIDLQTAFDRVRRTDVRKSLDKRGVAKGIIETLKGMYKSNKIKVRMHNNLES